MPNLCGQKVPILCDKLEIFIVFDWGVLLESVFVFFVGAHGYAPLREDKAISGYFRRGSPVCSPSNSDYLMTGVVKPKFEPTMTRS